MRKPFSLWSATFARLGYLVRFVGGGVGNRPRRDVCRTRRLRIEPLEGRALLTATVSVSAMPSSVDEGTEASFTIELSELVPEPVTVSWNTVDGTATAGEDYQGGNGTVTFETGELVKTISVPTFADDQAEPDETFAVHLGSAQGAAVDQWNNTATVTITDVPPDTGGGGGDGEGGGDPPPEPTITVANATGTESPVGQPVVRFRATLSEASQQAVSFKFSTRELAPVEAKSNIDYTAVVDQVVTIDAGALFADFDVPIIDDDIDEPDQRFEITLSNAVHGTLGTATATGTIVDDEDEPTVHIGLPAGAAGLEEGNQGSAQRTVKVSLSRRSEKEVGVDLVIEQLTAAQSAYPAKAPQDFQTGSVHIDFEPGMENPSKDLLVTVVGDVIYEYDEEIGVRVTAATNAAHAAAATKIAILNDDDAPTVAIESEYYFMEGHDPQGTQTIILSVDGETERDITLYYQFNDDTAIYGTDYALGPASPLEIDAGSLFDPELTVYLIGDRDIEPTKHFSITLTSADGATIDDVYDTADVYIVNDDTAPVLSAETYQFQVGYAADAGEPVGSTPATDEDCDPITYSLEGATEGLFEIDANGKITMVGNLLQTTTELFTFTVRASDPYGHSDTATVQVKVVPTVAIGGDLYGVENNGDTITLTFTRHARNYDQPLDVSFTVDWQVTLTKPWIGRAELSDLQNDQGRQDLESQTIQIPAGDPSVSITLRPTTMGDFDEKHVELFRVTVNRSTTPGAEYEPATYDDPSDLKDKPMPSLYGFASVYIVDGVTLFAEGTGDGREVHENDVVQGGLADCYFMAAVAATALREEASIRARFSDPWDDNGTQKVTITFIGHAPVHLPLDLDLPMTAGRLGGDFDSNGAVEIWHVLLEQAYAEASGGYGEIAYGLPGEILAKLASGEVTTLHDTDPGFYTIDLRNYATPAYKLVVATKNSLPSGAGLYENHSYVVIEIFDDGGTSKVRLYNPHGSEEVITTAELYQSIKGIYYQPVGGAP
ncbi:MAG TPA: Calx-beta domain-containing protein [Pirellulaceae bacterium]|nr:Calx-beta domain-containing protein [Pirellulaceae bacterium]